MKTSTIHLLWVLAIAGTEVSAQTSATINREGGVGNIPQGNIVMKDDVSGQLGSNGNPGTTGIVMKDDVSGGLNTQGNGEAGEGTVKIVMKDDVAGQLGALSPQPDMGISVTEDMVIIPSSNTPAEKGKDEQLYVKAKMSDVTIPNFLTPNGDGNNDKLVIKGIESHPKSQLMVFSKSGALVFMSSSYKNEWDGKNMQTKEELPPGVYYYILTLDNGSSRLGFLTLAK